MTRETKIGLLVGLAFIIVIGILLSDHVTSSTQPPSAQLSRGGDDVRDSIKVPVQQSSGHTTPVVTQVGDIQPVNQVPTQQELAPRAVVVQKPVQASENAWPGSQTATANTSVSGQPGAVQGPAVNETASTLNQVAQQNGEPLVPVDARARGIADAGNTTNSMAGSTSARTYVAQAGDTLSHIALHQLGANTKSNRDAIIRVNPSLQANPNIVIAGRTYIVPGNATPAVRQVAGAAQTAQAPIVPESSSGSPSVVMAKSTYVCQSGDSLWKIADRQLGDGKLWTRIRDLNSDVLKGGDTVQPGMTLRLPLREVASVD